MHHIVLRYLTKLYRAIPQGRVRAVLFSVFCVLVRRRKTISTIRGITYDLDLSEVVDLSLYLDQYEQRTISTLRRYVQPGWTVLDIGANIGALTLPLAGLVGSSGTVFAFEPTDFAYPKLLRNVSLNAYANIRAVKLALSNENAAQQRISFRATWPTNGKPAVKDCYVDFRRLDDWLREFQVLHVDLIKLDVDGYEYMVLDGAREMLAQSRPILAMEANICHFATDGRNPLKLLGSIGYRFFDDLGASEYRDVADILKVLAPTQGLQLETVNIIALPPEEIGDEEIAGSRNASATLSARTTT